MEPQHELAVIGLLAKLDVECCSVLSEMPGEKDGAVELVVKDGIQVLVTPSVISPPA